MQFTVFSVLAFAASMVSASAVPHSHFARQNATTHPNCVGGLLNCPQLKTPLDPILDPILQALDINGSALIGDIGLLCMLSHQVPFDSQKQFANVLLLLQATLTMDKALLAAARKPTFSVAPLLLAAKQSLVTKFLGYEREFFQNIGTCLFDDFLIGLDPPLNFYK